MKEARKDDAAKIRMDLIPPEFLHGTAAVLTFGAKNTVNEIGKTTTECRGDAVLRL